MNRFGTAPTRLDLPSLHEIVRTLAGRTAAEDPHLGLGMRVTRGFIFGSFARGEQHPDSDIDVLLEILPLDGSMDGLECVHRARLAASPRPATWRGHVIDVYLTGDAERAIREVVRGPVVEMRR